MASRRRNKKGFDTLNAQIAKVRALASVPTSAAPEIGKAVSVDAKANAARGVDPSGKAWRKTKDGGKPVLKNAAKSITVRVERGAIVITTEGRHARHHQGYVRGTGTVDERARRVIPTTEIPKSTAQAMDKATQEAFRKAMKK